MQRIRNVMVIAFWTSVPLFGVCLAASWALGGCYLWWPGVLLWPVVGASSTYLTALTLGKLYRTRSQVPKPTPPLRAL